MPRQITEEKDKETLDAWKLRARELKTPEDLAEFVRTLTTEYEHDYGTICHAIAAAMRGAMRVVDESPQGGITGFQASCIGWMMVDDLFGFNKEAPKRILDFGNLLYPQYEEKFGTISAKTLEWVREEAKKKLAADTSASPAVIAHWQAVANGLIPFGLRVAAE